MESTENGTDGTECGGPCARKEEYLPRGEAACATCGADCSEEVGAVVNAIREVKSCSKIANKMKFFRGNLAGEEDCEAAIMGFFGCLGNECGTCVMYSIKKGGDASEGEALPACAGKDEECGPKYVAMEDEESPEDPKSISVAQLFTASC